MKNSEIVVISNQYKDTLKEFINSSDTESSDWAKPIDERFCNVFISEGSLADFLEGDCFDENLPDRSLQLALKTENLQMRQYHVIAF